MPLHQPNRARTYHPSAEVWNLSRDAAWHAVRSRLGSLRDLALPSPKPNRASRGLLSNGSKRLMTPAANIDRVLPCLSACAALEPALYDEVFTATVHGTLAAITRSPAAR